MVNMSACLLHSLLPTQLCVFCNPACIPQALRMPLKFLMGTGPLSFIYFNDINSLFSQERQNSCIAEYFKNNKNRCCASKILGSLQSLIIYNALIYSFFSAHTLSTCHAKALENKVDLILKPMGVCSVEDRQYTSNHRVPQLIIKFS